MPVKLAIKQNVLFCTRHRLDVFSELAFYCFFYKYLTGGEFGNRIRYILESYDEMAKQLDIEKKQAQKRWAVQEKTLQKVTSSLYGISGDLQGIAGKEIIALPAIEESGDGGSPIKAKSLKAQK